MQKIFNKITNENRFFISNNNYRMINNRKRYLLMQIISKSIMREKYKLNDCFSKWYKNTMKIISQERKNQKQIFDRTKIIKNEKFEIIQKKEKRDKSCGNVYIPNKLERIIKIEFKNNKRKKDEGILMSLRPYFKNESLKKSKINNDIYKSYKKPIILRQIKNEITTILGTKNKILTQEKLDIINNRKNQLLYNLIKKKLNPKEILLKYLTIWSRKHNIFLY